MEILVAVLGPMMGGLISLVVFVNKKNGEFMNRIHESVTILDQKIDDLRLNVASNYVTNDQLTNHIQSEESWHVRFSKDLQEMRNEVSGTRVIVDRMWMDFQDRGKV